MRTVKRWIVVCLLGAAAACEPQPEESPRGATAAEGDRTQAALAAALERIAAHADGIDEALRPLPLLRPQQEAALRRYLNPQQLQRARTLGVAPERIAADLETLVRDGRLVRLDESTEHWIIRDLGYSEPLVTPDARALLVELAGRFQDRLADLGIPPLRIEVSSVLRTPEDQAALRRTNPNAAAGVSTHEFGTTFDVLYSAFAAPLEPMEGIDAPGGPSLAPHLESIATAFVERVAGRRALELKAILGEVLIEMQGEGKVMVTLERQQPVYHMTVARALAQGG